MSLFQELEHLKIPLDAIKRATRDFSDNNILGLGGFGRVYKGQLAHSTRSSEPSISVAVKRLDVKGGQGDREFKTEIAMLASYKHDNIVCLIGFCDEDNEKVLVYKYEVNGSLDKHLASADLTWAQRLRICLGAAHGLEYLHGRVGVAHKVIHRDIKSSNILLDANWDAKISDFGLSKLGLTNQNFTFLITNAGGTFAYIDPQYRKTGVLTKESDVYSLGIVLFEVLYGRLAMIQEYNDERRFLSNLVKLKYGEGKLDEISIPNLRDQLKPYPLQVFFNIAFQCLYEDRKQRPSMSLVVKELETALKHQIDTPTELSPQIGFRKLVQTELWGSFEGGSPWSFVLYNQKLRKIAIDHDSWIYSVVFTAEDLYGSLHSYPQYGGTNGPSKGEITTIDFDTDEEIIGICGATAYKEDLYLILSLCFVTNKKKYGIFGDKHGQGRKFSQSWDMGSFAGFYGRAGFYLDSIGCWLKSTI